MPFNAVVVILWLCAVIWITAEISARTRKLAEQKQTKKKNDISLEDFEK